MFDNRMRPFRKEYIVSVEQTLKVLNQLQDPEMHELMVEILDAKARRRIMLAQMPYEEKVAIMQRLRDVARSAEKCREKNRR